MTSLTTRLQALYTGVVYDTMSDMGLPSQALPPEIQPLDPGKTVAGPVWTLSGVATPSVSRHDSLLSWTEFLSKAPADHVIVCQPNCMTLALMGELSAETLKSRGVLGYIVDGGSRDIDFIVKLGFPVFCRFRTPADIAGRWRVDEMGQPIKIGQTEIATGDYAIADQDGAVIIPGDRAEAVIAAAEAAVNSENKIRDMILSGGDPKEAYLQYGKF